MNTDVLVVGAGPTGLMLANQLGRRGVRVAIVDRHSGPAQQTRAMAVHARTLEIYAQLGIAAQALLLGHPTEAANMWANGEQTARIPLGDIGRDLSPFPYVLMLGQDDNERIMGDKLRDWGVDVQWNTELVALEQKTGSVEAVLRQPDGSSRTLETSYLAGCDGVHSAVRELSEIAFPGAPYEHVFFVADTEATGSMAPRELNVFLWRRGFHLFFPMRGRNLWRVIGILPQQLSEQPDLSFEQLIPAIRGEAGADLAFQACHWFSTYHIHHRCAERFRERRCFLLGDAAHVHSPVGGQGMNTGLQDACNLAWKLALALEGRAGDSLLDSYAQERRAVAQNLLGSTDRAFTVLVSGSAFAGLFRTHIFAHAVSLAMRFSRVRERVFRTVSQIGIHYRASALSETLADCASTAPRAGDRFPWLELKFKTDAKAEDLFERLDDTRFNLIVVGQPLPQPAAVPAIEAFAVHDVADDPANDEVLERAGLRKPSYFVVRPDGHIALAGGRIQAQDIERYFAGRGIRLSPHAQTRSPSQVLAPGVLVCMLATLSSLMPGAHAADGVAVFPTPVCASASLPASCA
jgi:2-polyprenyl-6-methoxyphenol hydroxylase-like FAD-dependent oxidoreductase